MVSLLYLFFLGIIPSDSKNFFYNKDDNEIHGKKIDFNAEFVEYYNDNKTQNIPNIQNLPQNINIMKLNQRINLQNGYINNNNNINNNMIYNNNLNNNIYNQNRPNIINNNIEYSNLTQKMSQNQNINNITNNNNSINYNNSININTNPINNNNTLPKCTCSKTGCRKKYCACFSKGRLCDGCECKNCQNCIPSALSQSPIQNLQNDNIEDEYNNENEIQSPKNQRVICNCTKSNCMKKYCECFKQGFRCNSLCRCLDCKNKIYINSLNDYVENNNTNINNTNVNYNINNTINNNNDNNVGYNNNNYISNDSISNNNFYNYALHNNINNNIINNNIINTVPEGRDISPIFNPDTLGKIMDYSNPINFQSEAFAIYIKKEKLKIDPRKVNLNENNKIKNKEIKEKANNNKEPINNNLSEINETPKFSNKKRLRDKNDNSTTIKTCPTTNSSNKLKKAVPVVNKNIKKKKLQLN